MLYKCAACIEHCGPVPEAWIGLCCRPESQHFWLRGLVPRAWTTAEPITSEEVVRAGYFLDPAAFEGQEVFFATDGSGGRRPFYQRPQAESVRGRLLLFHVLMMSLSLLVVSLGAFVMMEAPTQLLALSFWS